MSLYLYSRKRDIYLVIEVFSKVSRKADISAAFTSTTELVKNRSLHFLSFYIEISFLLHQ